MSYGGKPWGYIHKKKELAAAEGRHSTLKSSMDDFLNRLKKELDEQHKKGNVNDDAYEKIKKLLDEFKVQ